tara:strand:- start:3449 stop:4351 length:903 start_codon:yes stop_codon:yes gene_type:complete
MSFINKIILFFATKLPKSIIKLFAMRYVAGESALNAIKTAKRLNDKGFSVTLDILGEHVKTQKEAIAITDEYVELFKLLYQFKIDGNISIKPSHIGLDISVLEFEKNLSRIVKSAADTGNFLRIDMESSLSTDQTIISTLKYQKLYNKIGTVIQAYLFRTIHDIDKLNENDLLNIRLCKGIYKESNKIAIQSRYKINENYLKIVDKIMDKNGFIGLATHDLNLIKNLYKKIKNRNYPNDKFEFQVLYGVPMGSWLKKNLENNFKTRVYIPFGPNWYDYSIRRLKENPNIAGYILQNIFNR